MRIIVSLTTLPGRQELLKRTIASLQRQTLRPDAIFLWLPIERFGTDRLPAQFAGVEARLGPDLGPAMKILPLLPIETDPETLLIPVDDDIEYPPELIQKLALASSVFSDRAIGFTGWNAIRDVEKTQIFHFNESIAGTGMFQSVHVLEGYRGVAYRRRFFELDIFKHLAALDAFRFHDDILLSGYLASRGVTRCVQWFGSSPAPSEHHWKLHGADLGLHTGPGWFERGVACLDYWNQQVPGIFPPIAVLPPAVRLQLGVNQNPHDGFLHHGQPGVDVPQAVMHDLNNIPWPWPDECFDEILALEVFAHLSIAPSDWLKECGRILTAGGVLKVRLPAASVDRTIFGEVGPEKTGGIADGFRSFWEDENGKRVGTLIKR